MIDARPNTNLQFVTAPQATQDQRNLRVALGVSVLVGDDLVDLVHDDIERRERLVQLVARTGASFHSLHAQTPVPIVVSHAEKRPSNAPSAI
jgi:hypothetical protein